MLSNAMDGLKKIYLGILFQLIAIAVGVVATLISMIFGDESGFVAIISVIFSVAVILLIIANYVFQLLGTFKNKDIDFICLIVCVVVAILNFIISNTVISSINSILATAAAVLAVYFILTGVLNLVKELGNSELEENTKKTRLIIMILLIVAGVISFVSIVMRGGERLVMGIMSTAEMVVTLVAYIMYFLFMKKITS